MTPEFSLLLLKNHLEKEDCVCTLNEPSEEDPAPKLSIFFGMDHLNQSRYLTIGMKDQMFSPTLKKDNSPVYSLLIFEVAYSFEAKDHAVMDTARFVSFINRYSDFPGFEFDEILGKLFFRYVQLIHKKMVDLELILGTIGIILLQSDLYGPEIENCASGKKTMNELIENALTTLEMISSSEKNDES